MADSNPIPPDNEGKPGSIPEVPEEITESSPNDSPKEKPVGPDGKPLPGPGQVQKIRAERQIVQLHAQVDEVIVMYTNNRSIEPKARS